jgi:hypothetical protein
MESGEAAGRIWPYLVEHGETTRCQLQCGATLSARLQHMGVGWLARDNTLDFVQERGGVKLTLHQAFEL